MEDVVDRAEDLREKEEVKRWAEEVNRVPSNEDIVKQMKLMRDSALGEDGVRLKYLMMGGEKVIDEVVRMV